MLVVYLIVFISAL